MPRKDPKHSETKNAEEGEAESNNEEGAEDQECAEGREGKNGAEAWRVQSDVGLQSDSLT